MKKSTSKKPAKTTKSVAKKAPAKKTIAKPVAKKAPVKKAPVKKTPAKSCSCKKSATKMCKNNPQKKCCGKKNCTCHVNFGELVSEIFGQLGDIKAVENLLKDYFFTELLKKGFEEAVANAYANKLLVDVEAFEANIDIDVD